MIYYLFIKFIFIKEKSKPEKVEEEVKSKEEEEEFIGGGNWSPNFIT
jgi:hypothetical protein